MPFWRKSEDPWDKKDGISKPPKEPKEPKENPVDTLKAWVEDRKAEAKEREEARRLPTEKCPWCGKDMEQGNMLGGRDSVLWYPGILTTKDAWFGGGPREERLQLCDEGGFTSYKTVWLCRDCKKMVFNMPDPPTVYDPFADTSETEKTKEEEESEE